MIFTLLLPSKILIFVTCRILCFLVIMLPGYPEYLGTRK